MEPALAAEERPWNERAAASEIAPDSTIAPAMNHRLMRDTSASAASRVWIASRLMVPMIRSRRKKALSAM